MVSLLRLQVEIKATQPQVQGEAARKRREAKTTPTAIAIIRLPHCYLKRQDLPRCVKRTILLLQDNYLEMLGPSSQKAL
jgi:hypothetical protein